MSGVNCESYLCPSSCFPRPPLTAEKGVLWVCEPVTGLADRMPPTGRGSNHALVGRSRRVPMAASLLWGGSCLPSGAASHKLTPPLPPSRRQVVREHWEGQPPQCLEDPVRSQHIPGTARHPSARNSAQSWGPPTGMGLVGGKAGLALAPPSPHRMGVRDGFPGGKALDTAAGHTLQGEGF